MAENEGSATGTTESVVRDEDAVLVIEGLRQEFSNSGRAENFSVVVDRLALPRGGFIAIQGPNGCGKTTLVTVLALLRCPSNLKDSDRKKRLSRFTMSVATGQSARGNDGSAPPPLDLRKLWGSWWGRHKINLLRRKYLGFAPQQLELLPALKSDETVACSLWLNGIGRRRDRVAELLEQFDVAKVGRSRINRISGGQQQKVTLARAIAHRPPLIFLDEPTAYLYHKDARDALNVLRTLQQKSGEEGRPITVVMITHDKDLARDFATHVVNMTVLETNGQREGHIVQQQPK